MKNKELGTVKDLRIDCGATQAYLASKLGMTQAALSRLEGRADLSISMLRSYVEALGGKLELTAVFSDSNIRFSGYNSSETVEDLRALVYKQCYIHPMPSDRATDRFMVRRVDDSLVELQKLSNQQVIEIPVRRVLEVLPETSIAPPTIVLRGSLKWSGNEKLWRVSLD